MPDKYVIITAGGMGARMGSTTPKQFLELNKMPVIMHSIRAFIDYSRSLKLILVLPDIFIAEWGKLCRKHDFTVEHEVCSGGETRFQSVKNGLKYVDEKGLVAIHDAVRPVVSLSLIDRCFEEASQKGNAIPAMPLKDSVREISGDENRPVDREKFRLMQTPQVFETSLIKRAYDQAYRASFTDDATVVESMGITINLIDGESKNIKVTTPDDMIIAGAFLKGIL